MKHYLTRTSLVAALAAVLLMSHTVTAFAACVPIGSAFQVNQNTTGSQIDPVVGVDDQRNFVILWNDEDAGTTVARFITRRGAFASGEIKIDDVYPGAPRSADFDTAGNMLLAFEPEVSNEASFRRFDSTATPIGAIVSKPNPSFDNDLTVYPDGSLMMVWTDGSSADLYGQRFLSTDAADGLDFRVNTVFVGLQEFGEIASSPSGDKTVVVYDSFGRPAGQAYNNVGSPIGAEFLVEDVDFQYYPKVGVAPGGEFVVSWVSRAPGEGASQVVRARRWNSDGSPNGDSFTVPATPTSSASQADVGVDSKGRFVVMHGSEATCFTETGTPLGAEFLIDSASTPFPWDEKLAMRQDGVFMVTWDDNAAGSNDIFARLFRFAGCGDGFLDAGESCDDGNAENGDGCDIKCAVESCWLCTGEPSVCTYQGAGAPCDDNNECTENDMCNADPAVGCVGADVTDGIPCGAPGNLCGERQCISGMCIPTTFPCGPCKVCIEDTGAPLCVPSADQFCFRPFAEFASILILKENAKKGLESFIWKWKKGESFDLDDLGDLATNPFLTLRLELYQTAQGAPTLAYSTQIPGGGTCGDKPCWKATKTGFVFKGRDSGQNHPIDKLVMKSGPDGKSKIILKSIDPFLQLPALETLQPPILVNLILLEQIGQNTLLRNGWGADYDFDGLKRADEKVFKAKGD